MTLSYGTVTAIAAIAFGVGVAISANAAGTQTDPELAVLQQIEKNTETTNAQLTLLNQQISKLATSLKPASGAGTAQRPGGSAPDQGPNPPHAPN